MEEKLDQVRGVAQKILDRLGHPALCWEIIDVYSSPTFSWPPDASLILISSFSGTRSAGPTNEAERNVSVVIGSSPDDEDAVVAYYSMHVPEVDAVRELASQMQDHAIEKLWGAPLPPCPGHAHPLNPKVVNDVAVWQCPNMPSHHTEPIR